MASNAAAGGSGGNGNQYGMNCNKPFCLMMYNGQKNLLADVAEAKAKRDMYEKNFNMLFTEAQKNGTVSSRTGDLVMPTGDVLTPELFMERTRMFNENRQALERRTKELEEVRNGLKDANDNVLKRNARIRELEERLSWFDKPRDVIYSNETHQLVVAENAKLKEDKQNSIREIDNLKRCVQKLEEGRPVVEIPASCPMGGCDHGMYTRMVVTHSDPVKALGNHLRNFHFCRYCKTHLKDTVISLHEGNCSANKLKIRVPKRPRVEYVQDDLENGTEEERAAIQSEIAGGVSESSATPTFVIPVTEYGLVDMSKPFYGEFCRFCYQGPFSNSDVRGEHEDICAPPTYPRFQCPCYMYSDIPSMNVCWYWAVEERRAWRHARRENRRKFGEITSDESQILLCPTKSKPLPDGCAWSSVTKLVNV